MGLVLAAASERLLFPVGHLDEAAGDRELPVAQNRPQPLYVLLTAARS